MLLVHSLTSKCMSYKIIMKIRITVLLYNDMNKSITYIYIMTNMVLIEAILSNLIYGYNFIRMFFIHLKQGSYLFQGTRALSKKRKKDLVASPFPVNEGAACQSPAEVYFLVR